MSDSRYLIYLIILLALTSCITVQKTSSPQQTYLQVQNAYLAAWSSYHKVWLALSNEDPRKREWVQTYHPRFLDAANALTAWAETPSSTTLAALAQIAVDKVEDVLIQLAIKKEVQ